MIAAIEVTAPVSTLMRISPEVMATSEGRCKRGRNAEHTGQGVVGVRIYTDGATEITDKGDGDEHISCNDCQSKFCTRDDMQRHSLNTPPPSQTRTHFHSSAIFRKSLYSAN